MMMRNIRPVVAFATMIVVVGGRDLSGWGKTWMGVALRQAVQSSKWKFGPFYIAPVLYLTEAGYDSNLYYGYAGIPVKDYTVTAGPGFSIYLPIKKKLVLQVDESPRYVYYHTTKSERAWNNYFNARVNLALNKLFISVGGTLNRARQRWSTEVDIRPRRREKTYEGAALWQATKKTSFYVQGSRTIYDYENLNFDIFNLRDRLNRTEDRLNVRTYYQLTNRARFFVGGEYGNFTFERKVSNAKDSRSYGLFGGVEFAPLGVVRGRINVGHKIFTPLDKARSRYQGLVGDSQVSVKLFRFLTVRSSYRRDIQFSVWYDNTYYVEGVAGAGASLYLLKKFRLDYDYVDGRNRYPESQAFGSGPQIKRRDGYRIHSVGLYFRLKKNMAIGLVANRWERDSNLIYEISNRDFVGMNLTYDF